MPHCSRCGAPLNIGASGRTPWKDTLKDGAKPTSYLRADEFGQVDTRPDSRDALAREMQDLKKRKEEGLRLQQRLRRESGRNPSPLIVDEVTPESDPAAARNSGAVLRMRRTSPDSLAEEREREARHRVRYMDDTGVYLESRTYDPPAPPLGAASAVYTAGRASTLDLPLRMRRRRRFLRGLMVLVILAVLGAGGLFGYRFLQARAARNNPRPSAVVTASMLNEVAAHTILIPGEEGDNIYIRELHASYTVVDGFATVEVEDHIWYDNVDTALDETMDVTLTPFLKTASGRQTPMDPITYTITIPLSPIKLESPDSLRTTVSTTMAAIRVTVRPGSRVTVNGVDYSDTVSSESGEMSYNATVQPIGDNVFNIVVRSQYCRDNTLTVVLYRKPQEIPLDLAVGTYGSTDQDVMKVTATTLPGAYVEVTTPHSDLDITDLDTTGKFTFNALFDKIGYNTISISASYPGKQTSTVDHTVYYLPPPDKYTTKAWPLSAEGYSELLSNINVRAANSQVYVVTGVVQYSVSDKPQMVVINTSEDGKSQPVLVQNYTNTVWEVGTYYRLFADAYSTYNGMPWLNARYTYRK